MKNSKIILNIVVLLLLFSSCNRNRNFMPYVPVDLYINTSLPAYSNLNIIGGWVYATGGNNGIILYRQTYDKINAYERRCTYNVEEACGAGVVDSTGFTVNCDCDGTKYHIFDGSVIEGPATFALYQYNTTFNPDQNQLHVYN
jgi:nitrite reductase/ring-hydroxylating ferredoxin subunit